MFHHACSRIIIDSCDVVCTLLSLFCPFNIVRDEYALCLTINHSLWYNIFIVWENLGSYIILYWNVFSYSITFPMYKALYCVIWPHTSMFPEIFDNSYWLCCIGAYLLSSFGKIIRLIYFWIMRWLDWH